MSQIYEEIWQLWLNYRIHEGRCKFKMKDEMKRKFDILKIFPVSIELVNLLTLTRDNIVTSDFIRRIDLLTPHNPDTGGDLYLLTADLGDGGIRFGRPGQFSCPDDLQHLQHYRRQPLNSCSASSFCRFNFLRLHH